MRSLAFIAVFMLLAAVQIVHSEVVNCPDQQESCSCSPTAEVCEFTLRFEKRQTFTSYALSERNRALSFSGAGYFLDSNGYQPSLNGSGTCNFEDDLVNDEDFTRRNCSVPMTVDGVSYSSIITINGRTPGPTLIVTNSQTVVVHILNYLTYGLYQLNTPWMDGVGFITQPPIDPGVTFDYIFSAQPKGTFWYHSHVGSQRTDGIYGGLVIRDEGDTFQTDVCPKILPAGTSAMIIDAPENYTLTVIDWQRESSQDLFTRINSSLDFFPSKPVLQVPTNRDKPFPGTCTADGAGTGLLPYWSGLINGRGRMDNSTITPLSVFRVERNNYYRFRVIGTESLYAHKISIDGHILRVIATDGKYTEPQDVEFIVVHAGERYDFLVDTNNNNSQLEYWIRAETLEVLPSGVEHSARAILTYGNTNSPDWRDGYSSVPDVRHQCTSNSQCRVLNCPFENFASDSNMRCISLTNLSALFPPSNERKLPQFPATINNTHFLNFAFQGPNSDSSINARSFQVPTTSYQTNCNQYSDDLADNVTNMCVDNCVIDVNAEEGCRCINVLPLAGDAVWDELAPEFETIVMVFSGISTFFAHPIHMHGHAYHIVYIGYGTYYENGTLKQASQDIACEGKVCSNPMWANGSVPDAVMSRVNASNGRVTSSAIRKDTVIIPAGGYVVIAFQADNPGYWFLHCHVEEHQLGGMIVLLQEYTADQHRAPPSGINEHGSFVWTVEHYNQQLQEAQTCASVIVTRTPPTSGVSPNTDTITISMAGFGVTLAVIILLSIAGVIQTTIICCICIKKTNANLKVVPQ